MNSFRKGVFYAFLCAMMYGLNPVLARLAYAMGMQGLEILHYRFLFASFVMAIVGPFFMQGFYRIERRTVFVSLLIALLIMLPLNLFYVFALKDIPASLMSLITYVYPLVILMIGVILFKEPLYKAQLISVLMIILGCICIFSDALALSISCTALVLGFLSMVMYAIYLVALQRLGAGIPQLQLVFLTIVFCTVGICFTHNPVGIFSLDAKQMAISLAYGVISTVLAIVFLVKAIQCIGATEAGIFCSFEPVFTIVFSMLLLNEDIPIYRYVGIALLIMGIVVPNISRIKRSPPS